MTTDPSPTGLSAAEAHARLRRIGPNAFAKEKPSGPRTFFRQFFGPLNFILIFAAVLAFYMSDHNDAIAILSIVVLNSLLSFIQEFRSERAVARLSDLIERQTIVVRDGKQLSLDVSQLVPDDLVLLADGDVVPADLRLTAATELTVNESQLTGESVPQDKQPGAGHAGLLYAGSIIEHGSCQAVVVATGNHTELGKIALLSKNTKKVTPYQKSISEFSFSVLRIIGVTILLMLVIKIPAIHGSSDLANTILFIIALAMTVVPEALPLIITISLSSGALKLAKHNVVVKRLSAIEDLGRINILCTDKTGTLTQDKLSVTSIAATDAKLFQQLALATTVDFHVHNNKHPNSFDAAFRAYVPEKLQATVADWQQLATLPFDPDARRRRVVVHDPRQSRSYLVVIGALEALLPLAKTDRQTYTVTPGQRQLAIAYKSVAYQPDFDILRHETGLTLLGVANLLDPLRPTARATVDLAKRLGVNVKILTGDAPEVAAYIGEQVGLTTADAPVYTGADLDRMTIPQFKKAIAACNIFARVNPEQKYRIIEQLKLTNVVGYQGDGINDAPSLKLADASVAVKNATDVAKDSADIVLLESDLSVIIKGIRTGRSIFVNINKYIKHAMIGDIGNFFSLAVFYVAFSTDLPLLPAQLLLANLIQDLPHLAISSDRVEPADVARPLAASQTKSVIRFSLLLGVFAAVFYLVYFLFVGTATTDLTRTNLFIFFNLTQLVVIISARRNGFFWRGAAPSRPLLSGLIFFAALSVLIPYLPFLAGPLGFAPLPLPELGIILAVTITFLFMIDFVKVGLNRLIARHRRTSPPPRGRDSGGSNRDTWRYCQC
jgi:Mg2+-importing ATPase